MGRVYCFFLALFFSFQCSFSALLYSSSDEVSTIPPKMATVVERFFPKAGSRTIIVIQDVHSVPDAQEKIFEILEFLKKNRGYRWVGIEGALGRMNTVFLKSFPDQRRLKSLLKELLNEGEFTGAQYSAVMGRESAIYEGVEDSERYLKCVKNFLKGAFPRKTFSRQHSDKDLSDFKALSITREQWEKIKKRQYLSRESEFELAWNFYQSAEAREEKIVENALRKMEASGARKGVLVVGGFHAPGIAQLLKQKGCSYEMVIPRVEKAFRVLNYRPRMFGEVSWKSFVKETQEGEFSPGAAFLNYISRRLLKASSPETPGIWKSKVKGADLGAVRGAFYSEWEQLLGSQALGAPLVSLALEDPNLNVASEVLSVSRSELRISENRSESLKPDLSITVNGTEVKLFFEKHLKHNSYKQIPLVIYNGSDGKKYIRKYFLNPGQAVAEWVGYEIFKLFGFPVVSTHVLVAEEASRAPSEARTIGERALSVISEYVEGASELSPEIASDMSEKDKSLLRKAYYVDAFLNTFDRHGGNILIRPQPNSDGHRVVFIDWDHSLGFYVEDFHKRTKHLDWNSQMRMLENDDARSKLYLTPWVPNPAYYCWAIDKVDFRNNPFYREELKKTSFYYHWFIQQLNEKKEKLRTILQTAEGKEEFRAAFDPKNTMNLSLESLTKRFDEVMKEMMPEGRPRLLWALQYSERSTEKNGEWLVREESHLGPQGRKIWIKVIRTDSGKKVQIHAPKSMKIAYLSSWDTEDLSELCRPVRDGGEQDVVVYELSLVPKSLTGARWFRPLTIGGFMRLRHSDSKPRLELVADFGWVVSPVGAELDETKKWEHSKIYLGNRSEVRAGNFWLEGTPLSDQKKSSLLRNQSA